MNCFSQRIKIFVAVPCLAPGFPRYEKCNLLRPAISWPAAQSHQVFVVCFNLRFGIFIIKIIRKQSGDLLLLSKIITCKGRNFDLGQIIKQSPVSMAALGIHQQIVCPGPFSCSQPPRFLDRYVAKGFRNSLRYPTTELPTASALHEARRFHVLVIAVCSRFV